MDSYHRQLKAALSKTRSKLVDVCPAELKGDPELTEVLDTADAALAGDASNWEDNEESTSETASAGGGGE
jgi:hypothetical protein